MTPKSGHLTRFIICALFAASAFAYCAVQCPAAQDSGPSPEGQIACYASIKETDILSAMIYTIENKRSRTEIEEGLLEIGIVIDENKDFLDERTIKEFNDTAYLARIIDERGGVMRGVVAKKITDFAEEQRSLYSEYIKNSEEPYGKIEKLLRVNSEKADSKT